MTEPAPTPPSAAADALVRAGRGDERAFAEFYDEVSPTVYGIVLRVLRNPAMAEEVTQDVFVELWRQAPQFDPDRGNPKSWAATFAHRRAVDRVRSEHAAREREERDAIEQPSAPDLVADQVVDQIVTDLEQARVANSIRQLSELQREAITLAYFGGHTYREVAKLLDTPEGTIKTRIRDGLSRLRVLLEVPA